MNELESMALLRCPVCKGPLEEDATGFACLRCPERFPSVDGIWDLRSSRCKASTGGGGWDLGEFESAYERIGDCETSRERAVRAGIPEYVEAYRYARIKGRLLEWAASHRSPRAVLDVGCGVGYFLHEVDERLGAGDRLLAGVDVVPVRIRNTLQKFAGRQHFLAAVASAEELPFAGSRFDIVTCTEVMEHVERPETAFREIARVLRPGGMLCFSSPNRVAAVLWERVFGIPRFFRRVLRGSLLEGGARPYDVPIGPGRLKRLFRDSGLRIEEMQINVFLPHESYYQFLPGWVNRTVVAAGGCLEACAPALRRWIGLHYVVRARRPVQPAWEVPDA